MLSIKRVLIVAFAILIIPAAAAAWWLLSPLLVDEEVDEKFPFSAQALVPADMTRGEVEQKMVEAAIINVQASETMAEATMMTTGGASDDASQLVRLKVGGFSDADAFHKGSGTATIYEGKEGLRVLRLEDFRVTNGPELHVILSPSANPRSRDEVTSSGYVDLGKLKGNVGNQNYAIPEGVEISEMASVVIYCKPFHVIFSVASLEDTAD